VPNLEAQAKAWTKLRRKHCGGGGAAADAAGGAPSALSAVNTLTGPNGNALNLLAIAEVFSPQRCQK
jgi:hypothetical protein